MNILILKIINPRTTYDSWKEYSEFELTRQTLLALSERRSEVFCDFHDGWTASFPRIACEAYFDTLCKLFSRRSYLSKT